MLSIGSAFSGIGGLELGLERAGLGPVKWQAESDPFARQVLARHWPQARRYEDVRDVDRDAAAVELVCGGFPCQDLSLAGLGAGLDGARSGLWVELVRVARELGCRYLVVENVAALLARGLGTLLGALSESGFDAAWDCLPAAAVGAPHRRDRLFVVAWRVPDAVGHPLRQRAERGEGPAPKAHAGHAEPRELGAAAWGPGEAAALGGLEREAMRRAGDVLADPDRWRREVERLAHRQPGEQGAPRRVVDGRDLPLWPPASDDLGGWRSVPEAAQPALRRVADGAARPLERARARARRHRLRALGNAVVPAVAEVLGRLLVEAERERRRVLERRTREEVIAGESLALEEAM